MFKHINSSYARMATPLAFALGLGFGLAVTYSTQCRLYQDCKKAYNTIAKLQLKLRDEKLKSKTAQHERTLADQAAERMHSQLSSLEQSVSTCDVQFKNSQAALKVVLALFRQRKTLEQSTIVDTRLREARAGNLALKFKNKVLATLLSIAADKLKREKVRHAMLRTVNSSMSVRNSFQLLAAPETSLVPAPTWAELQASVAAANQNPVIALLKDEAHRPMTPADDKFLDVLKAHFRSVSGDLTPFKTEASLMEGFHIVKTKKMVPVKWDQITLSPRAMERALKLAGPMMRPRAKHLNADPAKIHWADECVTKEACLSELARMRKERPARSAESVQTPTSDGPEQTSLVEPTKIMDTVITLESFREEAIKRTRSNPPQQLLSAQKDLSVAESMFSDGKSFTADLAKAKSRLASIEAAAIKDNMVLLRKIRFREASMAQVVAMGGPSVVNVAPLGDQDT